MLIAEAIHWYFPPHPPIRIVWYSEACSPLKLFSTYQHGAQVKKHGVQWFSLMTLVFICLVILFSLVESFIGTDWEGSFQFSIQRRKLGKFLKLKHQCLEEDLITVFRGHTTEPIRIFKLDKANMVWNELDSMEGITIFLDRRTSLPKPCLEKSCGNQIYLSGFADDHCKSSAFYSLEISKYYPEIYHNFKEPMNCIWIEPSLTV